ncbi:MAG: DMT family transporter [Deferrisomatales bacterium]
MGHQTRACLYALATVLCWSTVAAAFKLSLRYLPPHELLLYSSAVALAVLGAWLAVQGKLGGVTGSARGGYGRSALLGALNPCLYYLVLFAAYDRLPAQVAQPLNYTWAITLALLSIPLLGQRIGWRDLGAAGVCYSGAAVICTGGDLGGWRATDPLGVALALGSTVIWALYWIYNTKDRRDPVVGLFWNFAFGVPLVLLYGLVGPGLSRPSPQGLLGAAWVGLFEMGIPFVLWLRALRCSENTAKVGNLIFLSPFLSLVFIHFAVGEQIEPSTVAGLGLIVGGLLLQRAPGGSAPSKPGEEAEEAGEGVG